MDRAAGVLCTKVMVPAGGQLSGPGVGTNPGGLPASRPETPLWLRPCQGQESFWEGVVIQHFLPPLVPSHWCRITQQPQSFNTVGSGTPTPAVTFWQSSWLTSGLRELKNKKGFPGRRGRVSSMGTLLPHCWSQGWLCETALGDLQGACPVPRLLSTS